MKTKRRFAFLAFDWDGTLADSTAEIVSAIEASCADLGIPIPANGSARQVIGLGHRDAIRAVAPSLAVADQPRFAERYRHHYLTGDGAIPLFDGVPDLLAELNGRGFLLGVATGKSRSGLDRAFTQYGVGGYFVASRCADEGFAKPNPDMLFSLMDRVGVTPDQTLMIGDTTHDLQLARNAGVQALGVSYGAHTEAELSALSPLAIVQSIAELRQWLAEHG